MTAYSKYHILQLKTTIFLVMAFLPLLVYGQTCISSDMSCLNVQDGFNAKNIRVRNILVSPTCDSFSSIYLLNVKGKSMFTDVVKYATDVSGSGDFDSRTLIDKGYADATYAPISGGGGSYTFSTGLTNTSGTIKSNLSTGVSVGQGVYGGNSSSSGGYLTLYSTAHATKGKIYLGDYSAYDEANRKLGILTLNPTAGIDIASGDVSFVLGANSGTFVRTNGTTKVGTIGGYHNTNAEEPVALLTYSSSSSANSVQIGGGSSLMNAATNINFYTASNINTTTGTKAMTINSSQNVGIGIDTPLARLHLVKTTEQARIGYDASNYYSTTVGSTGGVTFDAVGSSSSFTFSDSVTVPKIKSASINTGATSDDIALITTATGELKKSGVTLSSLSHTFSTGLTNTSGTIKSNLSTGVSVGQEVYGGNSSSSGGYLTLYSTAHATKGKIYLGDYSAYDEANRKLGILTLNPTAGIDIASGDISFVVGANSGTFIRTNGTTKVGTIGGYHNTNAEEPVALLTYSASSSANSVQIGGGSSLMNAATNINFYTASNINTTTGTKAMTINSSQNVGIGTDDPTIARLHVNAGGNENLRLSYNVSNYFSTTVASDGGTTFNTEGGGAFTFSDNVIVPSGAYASGWNGSNVVPTKDAIFDKIESMLSSDNVTLSSGTVTVTNSSITTSSIIQLTYKTPSGTSLGFLSYSLNAGTGFTITSNNISGSTETGDASTVTYTIVKY